VIMANRKLVSPEWHRRKHRLAPNKFFFPKKTDALGMTTEQYVAAFCRMNHLVH